MMRRKKPWRPTRKPINSISKLKHRREKRFVPASVLKQVKERSGGQCECTISTAMKIPYHASVLLGPFCERCIQKAMSQPHHILKRSQGGEHTKENLLDVCFEHHRWIEDNPKLAERNGLSQRYESK